MVWRKEYLDLILVPSGLFIMLGYHLFHLYRCLNLPATTVIGSDIHYRKAWVERVLQLEARDRGTALSVISTTISAANTLASISLALSSLIGAWVGSTSSEDIFRSNLIYGDRSATIMSLKYVILLFFFLVAFVCFLQCTRCFVHANFLISMPHSDVPVSYVQKAVTRGSVFWSVGVRAIYFATNLLLWIFGPIPMFLCSLFMAVMLQIFDMNSTPLHQFRPLMGSEPLRNGYEKFPTSATVPHHNGCHKEG